MSAIVRWPSCAWMSLLLVTSGLAQTNGEGQQGRDPETPQEESAPKPKLNTATLGWTTFRGNRGLEQYATPFTGLGLQSLRLLFPTVEGSVFSRIVVRGMPDQDNYQSALFQLDYGKTKLAVERYDFHSFVFDWRPRDESNDRATSFVVDQRITPSIGGFVSYSSSKRDMQYAAPLVPDQNHTQTLAMGVGGSVLGGSANLSATERRTSTLTGVQPTTLQRNYSASYSRQLSDTLGIIGSASFGRVEQVGLPSNDVAVFALGGDWDVSPATCLQFQFADQNLDVNSIENAYVRRRTFSSLRVLHDLPGWALQFGYRHQESERVRTDHLFVDVPKTDTIDFRATGRLGGKRLTVRGNWENVTSDAVMQFHEDDGTVENTQQLYWDNKALVQARLEGSGENFVGYGALTYRYRHNEARRVSIDWTNVAVGGSYVYNSALSGYAELSLDNFVATGASETGQTLDFYFPNAWNFGLGLDWAKSWSTTASASLNYYESGDVRGAQLTFNFKHVFPWEDEIELILAPWSRDDRQLDLTGFSTTFLSARYTTRF